MPTRETIERVIDDYCRAEGEKDRAKWMSLFTADVVHEDPVGVATRTGFEGLADLWKLIEMADVDLRVTDEIIICGNEAIALMACETGPANARRKTGPIVDLFTFNDEGKITSVRAFYKY